MPTNSSNFAKCALGTVYSVAAPFRSDVMTAALRSAYGMAVADGTPFADIMRELDRIEYVARHP